MTEPLIELDDSAKAKTSRTDPSSGMDDVATYKQLVQEIKGYLMREELNAEKLGKNVVIAKDRWYKCLATIVRNTPNLGYFVREELLDGCIGWTDGPEINEKLTDENYNNALKTDPNARRIIYYHRVQDIMPCAEWFWVQRKRFLWPAWDNVCKAALKSLNDEESVLQRTWNGFAQYSLFFASERTIRRQLEATPQLQRPEHPHPIDISLGPGKKRKATVVAENTRSRSKTRKLTTGNGEDDDEVELDV